MNSFGFNSYKSIGSVVLEQWLRLLVFCFLTLKPNSIRPITLHHLANNILLSFQFYKLCLSLRLSFYLMVIYGFEVFWLTHKGKLFFLGLFGVFFCGFVRFDLMWVFSIRFIYMVYVCRFASNLCSLL